MCAQSVFAGSQQRLQQQQQLIMRKCFGFDLVVWLQSFGHCSCVHMLHVWLKTLISSVC